MIYAYSMRTPDKAKKTKPLRYEAQKLRQLLHEAHLTHAELAYQSGVPIERIRTLTRGNAPMRIEEASAIASVFDRSMTVFVPDNSINDIRLYASKHKDEIEWFEQLLLACRDLARSYKQHPYNAHDFQSVPKDSYYDGSINALYKLAQFEIIRIDTLFGNVHKLWERNSILLAGTKNHFLQIATIYMCRWWDTVKPQQITAVRFMEEPDEKQLLETWRNIRALFESSEAGENDSYNLAKIELKYALESKGLDGRIKTAKQARQTYYKALTNIKKYEYFHFVQEIQELSKKTNTILGESLKQRIALLNDIGATSFDIDKLDKQTLGITKITYGYGTTIGRKSDTELTRLIIESENYKWFLNYEGEILASDKVTVIARSIEALATKMRKLGFFAGDKENQSTGILWQNIPDDEKKVIRLLSD